MIYRFTALAYIFSALLLFASNRLVSLRDAVAFAPSDASRRRRHHHRRSSSIFAMMARDYSSNNRFSESTTESSGGIRQQESRLRYVSLKKPMGLILEELDSSPAADDDDTNSEDGCFFVGTKIVDMAPGGSAAKALQDVCIGDKIMAVNDQDVSGANLEQVMECIAAADTTSAGVVRLTLQRPRGTVAVEFANGVAIAARPGSHLCNLAVDAHVNTIEYSCRNGACGTCEQLMMVTTTNDRSSSSSTEPSRYVRPCVATVPSVGAIDRIRIVPSDRYYSP